MSNTIKTNISEVIKSVSLQKLVVALNTAINTEKFKPLSYTTFLRSVSAPIVGEMYDPTAVNVAEIEKLLKSKGLTLAVFDTLNVEELAPEKTAREITFAKGDVWTHRNYLKTYNTGETNDNGKPIFDTAKDANDMAIREEVEIVAWTEHDVCVRQISTDTLHAMQIKTFRQGAPEFVRTASTETATDTAK